MGFEKGDIIWVLQEKRTPLTLRHPAVIWDDFVDDESEFHGIMLTHSGPAHQFENILMSDEHFESGHEIRFSMTYFVNQVFIKFQEWGPFHKSGKLTFKGIEFIESRLTNIVPTSFVEYINGYA